MTSSELAAFNTRMRELRAICHLHALAVAVWNIRCRRTLGLPLDDLLSKVTP